MSDMKKIPGHSNYSVTKDGQVWSHRSKKWLKPGADRGGYVSVNLYHKEWADGLKRCKIHRLVLETYVGPCPEGMECCHSNRNRVDNRLSNLRWGTRSDNVQDAIQHGTFAKYWLGKFGKEHNRSRNYVGRA